jgi:uncharacterized Zn finger protein (UPF0148 family)
MSGFDKEAERERLREKYERDQEKRAATQRMSELLLKGATMTNSHCDACGDPIFRHDGQAFCPTCQTPGGAGKASDSDSDATAPDDAAEAGSQADTASASTAAPSTPASTDDTAADGSAAPDADADADAPAGRDADDSRRAPSSVDGEGTPVRTTDAPVRDPTGGTSDVPSPRSSDAGDLGTARESLSRTLVRYARAAEDADDPRRATELLEAAREAAETLAALDPVR